MRIVYLTHSLVSCWNHGNAHFQRGVLRELAALGHQVAAWEPVNGWSRQNLLRDHGAAALPAITAVAPAVALHAYGPQPDLDRMLDGADLVIVHEWTEPSIIRCIARRRRGGGRFRLLFHDTHHRAVSAPEQMLGLPLDDFDGILAFGESLAEVWRGWGWPTVVWHEAADTARFRPPTADTARSGLVWIGNWGDGERTHELEDFLLRPAKKAGLRLTVHGVRYPEQAQAVLEHHGATYAGWLANHRVPEVFARHRATAHIPRRAYVDALPGIPTIRVFEALACGIPLAIALWRDEEGLFRRTDYLRAETPEQMARHLRTLAHDTALCRELADRGLETIRARHTCRHRAHELIDIAASLGLDTRLPIAEAAG